MTLPKELPEDTELLFEVDEDGKVLPVIPYADGDEFIHSPENPTCDDPTCPCHDEEEEQG